MSQNIHLIAVGGSVMHNMALALHDMGHTVTGSDDEIYEPSKSRLDAAGILPENGWDVNRIHDRLDAIILGMHAKLDNPELKKAQEMGLPIYSFPEYFGKNLDGKKVVVVAGSHGKTSTTSMIMHVLNHLGMDHDYLVGAQLEGYDRMVKLSDAPIAIIEGDEYLSSPIDRSSKMMHYNPDIAIITGIAWDHINVFPTYDIYVDHFRKYIQSLKDSSVLFYFDEDHDLDELSKEEGISCYVQSYHQIPNDRDIVEHDGKQYGLKIIGNHNMQNLEAARLACAELGISSAQFYEAIQSFTGAAKRLQLVGRRGDYRFYRDFAHAPSKVRATCDAVKDWFPEDKLYAVLELHTFSSLNKAFIPHYKHALEKADVAIVVFDEHTLKMKNMPALDTNYVAEQFDHSNIKCFDNNAEVRELVRALPDDGNLLIMTSGTLGGLEFTDLVD